MASMNKYFQFCQRTLNRIANLFDFTFQAMLVRTIPPSPPGTMMGARRFEKRVNVLLAVISPILLIVSIIYAVVALLVAAVAVVLGGFSRIFTKDKQPSVKPAMDSYAAMSKSMSESNKLPLVPMVAYNLTPPPSPDERKTSVSIDEEILSESDDLYDSLDSTSSEDDVEYNESCRVQ
jgi:hypothetical protein